MLIILRKYANRIALYLGVFVFLFFHFDSNGQDTIESKSLIQPKSTIVLYEAPDGSFNEYYFYDSAGTLVKKMRHDQFESMHPVFKLNLARSLPGNFNANFFEDLTSFSTSDNNIEPEMNPDAKLSELRSLKRFGLTVKTPEKATTIIGHPTLDQRPIISRPANKFLIKIETARILDAFIDESGEGSNSLLDCSYITIYDCMGNLFKEVLVPNKIVSFASISDDGEVLMCICEYSLVWDEGLSSKPEGVLIADLKTAEINYIVTDVTKNPFDRNSILFVDHYFQMTFDNPWSGGKCHRLFIDPDKRTYYIKTYAEDPLKKRKPIMAKSFSQFEGIREDIKEFNVFSY